MFIHRLGNNVIDTNFTEVTKDSFLKWKESFMNEIGYLNYEIILVGHLPEILYNNSNTKTFDVDIVVGSDKVDYSNIKKVFDSAISNGIKNKIFIDIEFMKRGNMSTHELEGTYYFIKPYIEIVGKNNKNITRPDLYCEKLPCDLWGKWANIENLESIKKLKKKINNGSYKGIKVDLKTMNIIPFNLTNKNTPI
jgi:hypothetical protein